MKPLGTRYCQNLDSADGATLKESVFDGMRHKAVTDLHMISLQNPKNSPKPLKTVL